MSDWQPARIAPYVDDGHCNPYGEIAAAWRQDAGKVIWVRPVSDTLCATCGKRDLEMRGDSLELLSHYPGSSGHDPMVCESQVQID